jgi:hypothetical protein
MTYRTLSSATDYSAQVVLKTTWAKANLKLNTNLVQLSDSSKLNFLMFTYVGPWVDTPTSVSPQ